MHEGVAAAGEGSRFSFSTHLQGVAALGGKLSIPPLVCVRLYSPQGKVPPRSARAWERAVRLGLPAARLGRPARLPCSCARALAFVS